MNTAELREVGLELRRKGRLKEAVSEFEEFQRRYPNDQRVYVDLAITLGKIGEYDAAMRWLQTLLDSDFVTDPWRDRVHQNLQVLECESALAQLLRPIDEQTLKSLRSKWHELGKQNLTVEAADVHGVFGIRLSAALGTCDVTCRLLLSQLEKNTRAGDESKRTIAEIISFGIKTGDLSLADDALALLDKTSHIYFRFQVDIAAKRAQLSGIERPESLNLRAHLDTKLLTRAFRDLDVTTGKKLLSNLDNFFDGDPPNLHRLKSAYLSEMEKLGDISHLHSIDFATQAGRKAFWSAVEEEAEWKQKVIMAGHYLNRCLGAHSKSIFNETPRLIVPQRIVQFWDKKEIPTDIRACMTSVKAACPEYDHVVFDEDSAADYLSRSYGARVRDIFVSSPHPAMKADIFRAFYLYSEGGIWLDADEEYSPISGRRFQENIQGNTIRFQSVYGIEIPNGFIACAPGDRLLHHVVEHILSLSELPALEVWWITGPGVFTYYLAKQFADELAEGHGLTWSLIHNHDYDATLRTPVLEYKDSLQSWQNLGR